MMKKGDDGFKAETKSFSKPSITRTWWRTSWEARRLSAAAKR